MHAVYASPLWITQETSRANPDFHHGLLEQENGDGEPIHQQDKVSTTDPDSTYLTKGNRAAELGYFDNYLIDNESCVIVGVQATAARLSQESAAARDMIDRYYERYGRRPKG